MSNWSDDYIKTSYELDVVPIIGQKFEGVVTSIPTHILVGHYNVDETRGSKDKGYQRPHNPNRSKILSDRIIEEDVVLPMSVTLNLRCGEELPTIKNNKFKYVPQVHNPLWVVDGQHRIRALELAMKQAHDEKDKNLLDKLANKNLPAVITFSKDRFTEIRHFTEINSHQKSVQVDQQLQNNVKRVDMGDTDLQDAMEKNGLLLENYQIPTFVENINADTGSLWHRRIKIPGVRSETPSVGLASMTKYVGYMFKSDSLKSKNLQQKPELFKKIFNAFWNGLELAYPMVFASPKLYSVQKAVGTDCLMQMLGPITGYIIENGLGDLTKAETYKPIFRKMIENMKGTAQDDDDNSIVVEGVDFWKAGRHGAVGNFSNEKGKKVLVQIMENAAFKD